MAWELVVENLSADGNSGTWEHLGGMCSVAFVGDFDSGTCKLQFTPDEGTTWVDVHATNASLRAAGVFTVNLADCTMRVNLAGAGSPDVDVRYQRYRKEFT